MNYRHAFHAGNHADVLKHVVLLALLDALRRKDSPFFVLDTHGGAGRYLLASEESRKTLEAEEGVMRLMAEPKLLIIDEPTRGIDVGAKNEIYKIMNDFVAKGNSIIMISSELPEVLGMTDRVYVMDKGRIKGELKTSEASQEAIMKLAVA